MKTLKSRIVKGEFMIDLEMINKVSTLTTPISILQSYKSEVIGGYFVYTIISETAIFLN